MKYDKAYILADWDRRVFIVRPEDWAQNASLPFIGYIQFEGKIYPNKEIFIGFPTTLVSLDPIQEWIKKSILSYLSK